MIKWNTIYFLLDFTDDLRLYLIWQREADDSVVLNNSLEEHLPFTKNLFESRNIVNCFLHFFLHIIFLRVKSHTHV